MNNHLRRTVERIEVFIEIVLLLARLTQRRSPQFDRIDGHFEDYHTDAESTSNGQASNQNEPRVLGANYKIRLTSFCSVRFGSVCVFNDNLHVPHSVNRFSSHFSILAPISSIQEPSAELEPSDDVFECSDWRADPRPADRSRTNKYD